MKVGIPIWNDRVSPVLDTAGQLLTIELEGGQEISRQLITLPVTHPMQRARMLCDAGIDTLICGAVSQIVQAALVNAGVRVLPFVGGDIEEIIAAFSSGRLESNAYRLPGCCRRRGRSGQGMGRGGRGRSGGGRSGGRW